MNFIENESAQKLRGGYYTPLDLATFLARWVAHKKPKSILEPSIGDGSFLRAAKKARLRAHVTGFEVNSEEAAKARACARELGLSATVHTDDFLGWALGHMNDRGVRFDAVLGNPPFIRYQYLPAEFQQRAEQVFHRLDRGFTKHTNAWVPFVLAAFALLRPGGRLGMVVPAEIIHVMHAQSLRSCLGEECRRLVIIDPEELWFAGTLQGAVLLLAEKREASAAAEGLAIHVVKDREFIGLDPETVFHAPPPINGRTVEGKWTRALLDKPIRDLLDELGEHSEVHRFHDIAQVDVGIVTGANKFFLVPDDTVERYRLARWAHPMFGRSGHCPGVIYDERQHQENARKGNPTNFIWFDTPAAKREAGAKRYIALGEEQKLHTRYKCRVRSPWYTVPSVYATEIGMLKRAHNMPRLILNRLGAYTTDTAYRVRSKVKPEKLVECFINPLTALSAELEGRHYGGGVLEMVPTEIEKLLIPLPAKVAGGLDELDAALRTKDTAQVLETHGRRVLAALGLSKAKQALLMEGWRKLRDRRHRTPAEVEVPKLIDFNQR
jgi:adenine-specific DNA methylase